ncbi:hypothetical protein OUZ56_002439 [Daphnia magna]|uniref:Uncharacterized protein n=1 Tax=Daphnia magna TaxID=35525 RepID=A0ABR0A5P9_9CRUS|nr:hypothetical protein OUZ56_002439 [Daphnia magna]
MLSDKNAIDYVNVGRPVTIEHYPNTKEGGPYNMEHDFTRFGPKQSAVYAPNPALKDYTSPVRI